ncbi:MAG TPA: protein kinase [Bryobacteraceae bacterium]|nr:protein kinase [Bryobacteraceae bacterium]
MKTIGKYQVADEIGRSAAGVTCRARDPFRNRDYVLKVLSPLAALSAEAKNRLYRDLAAVWELSHRHVAKVQDIGELEAVVYIATEHLAGGVLPAFLSSETPSLPDRLTVIAQTCEALAAAHSKGIAHGNLKPSNIFVTDTRSVAVLDFGTGTWQALLLASGVRLNGLLPNYLAPEQILGEPFDARSDIFAAGVLLYEIVAGRYPFQGAAGVIPREIVHAEAEPLRKWIADVPEQLEHIVSRAMKKDPRERFHTADELAADLYAVAQQLRREPPHVAPAAVLNAPEVPPAVQQEASPAAPLSAAAAPLAAAPLAAAPPIAAPDTQSAATPALVSMAESLRQAEPVPAATSSIAAPENLAPASTPETMTARTAAPLPVPEPLTTPVVVSATAATPPRPASPPRRPNKKRSLLTFAIGAVMALSMVGVIVVRQNLAAPGSHESAAPPVQATTPPVPEAAAPVSVPAKPTPFQAAPEQPLPPPAPVVAAESDPQAVQILRTQVRPLWEAGEYAQAMRLVDEVLTASPANAEARAWKKRIRAAQEAEEDIK